MILAAGRGERLRPLTDSCPKPLLEAGGQPLIVWHLLRLAAAGITEVVINHAHLGQMLEARLGDGARYGVSIDWSREPPGALETAGGIRLALAKLGADPFLVMNGDIYCDWDVAAAPGLGARLRQAGDLAHLVLVDNPPQHAQGDFFLHGGRLLAAPAQAAQPRLTFSGIGVYEPALFQHFAAGHVAKLAPLLLATIAAGRVAGEHYAGCWHDVGTVERLAALDAALRSRL